MDRREVSVRELGPRRVVLDTTVTEQLPHARLLLMTTADGTDPARRLYATDGWQVIGPGVADDQVIMAKGSPRAIE
jgi:hypothetical protein